MTKIAFATSLALLVFASSVFADDKPKKLTIATWNLEWFYDDNSNDNVSDLSKEKSAPSRSEWDWKLGRVARVVGEMKPTIMALQEIENRHVLRALVNLLRQKHGVSYRIAYIEGWDNFTEQDVAIIYREGLVQYSRREQTGDMFKSKEFYNLNKHLFGRFEWGQGENKESLTILNVHLRANKEKFELRQRQAKLIRAWLGELIANGENVVVTGDFNTEEEAEKIQQGSDMAIVCGWETDDDSDDLYDLHKYLPVESRSTHIGGGQFDRIFASRSAMQDAKRVKNDLTFSQIVNFRDLVVAGDLDRDHFDGFYKIPQDQRDTSDHYPVMAEFLFK